MHWAFVSEKGEEEVGHMGCVAGGTVFLLLRSLAAEPLGHLGTGSLEVTPQTSPSEQTCSLDKPTAGHTWLGGSSHRQSWPGNPHPAPGRAAARAKGARKPSVGTALILFLD